ncbi:CxxC-x17-CxxC domain-containing protein [archaeon]
MYNDRGGGSGGHRGGGGSGGHRGGGGGGYGGGRGGGGGGYGGGRGGGGGGGYGAPRQTYKAVCADCGKDCDVPFKPTEGRPVYCRDCYAKHKPKRDD